MNKKYIYKNNKGFTLVELIVVLVILAILAAILIPALLGYIDRAKNQKYIMQAREFMEASQVSIAEAYAMDKVGFKNSIRRGVLTGNKPQGVADYGYFSSNWAGLAMRGQKIENGDPTNAKGGLFKMIVCKKIVQYMEANDYKKISTKTPYLSGSNKNVSDFNKEIAFFIAYDKSGKIIYMQYTNEGKLVTFDGNIFEVQEGGEFVNHRN